MKNIFLKKRPSKKVLTVASKVSHNFEEEKKEDSYHDQDEVPLALNVGQAALASAALTRTLMCSEAMDYDPTIRNNSLEPHVDESMVSRGVEGVLGGHAHLALNTDDYELAFPPDQDDDVLFGDEEASPDIGIPSALLEMPDLNWPAAVVLPGDQMAEEDNDDAMSLPQSATGPPSEINIDLFGAPTSPMRDPSVVFAAVRDSRTPQDRDDLLEQLHYRPSGEGTTYMDQQNEQDLQTKLCDAQRLVRVILGKSDDPAKGMFSSLEHGSILQAIRTFAVMKKELLDLRQQQESKDGDPPAILTNLQSPATTRQTSDFSCPSPSNPMSSTSPVDCPDGTGSDDVQEQQRHLSVLRNAVVLAARKCQSLEQQLKHANETIDQLQLDQENLAQSKTPEELEDILARLHGVPASSVSREERKKIRSYVVDMLQSTKDQQHQVALRESRCREESSHQELEAAKKQIQVLQARLSSFTSSVDEHDDLGVIPNPLLDMQRRLREKDERIAQLEASQIQSQLRLQGAAVKSRQLLETNCWPNASDRLRLLEEEHQELANNVRMLEGKAVQL
jgi:hypothetical protein